jgi:hypothetical protein
MADVRMPAARLRIMSPPVSFFEQSSIQVIGIKHLCKFFCSRLERDAKALIFECNARRRLRL